jgi:hypothetical protein
MKHFKKKEYFQKLFLWNLEMGDFGAMLEEQQDLVNPSQISVTKME